MLKNFFKILAFTAGVSLVLYTWLRRINIWEIEAVKQQGQPLSASGAKAKKDSAKADDKQQQGASLNFERIGRATPEERDDLKKIKGVGPALEVKLNTLGIYTYEQIANFTAEDEQQVTEAISFFPGRIERDEWVKQARSLKKQKRG